MHILITGANGFIGSHLWAELEQVGHSVEGVDVHGTGPAPGVYSHTMDLLEKGEFADLVEKGCSPVGGLD